MSVIQQLLATLIPSGGGAAYTLSPTDKDASLVLSNFDRTVTKTGANGHATIRANRSLPLTGKFQWEVHQDTSLPNDGEVAAIAKATVPVTTPPGSHVDGYIYDGINGQKYNNSIGSAYGGTYGSGAVLTCLFDADNLKFYTYLDNVPVASADVIAGTGYAFIVSAGTYFPAAAIYDSGGALTFRLLCADMQYFLAPGFTDVSGATPAPVADPNFASVKALLEFQGADGSTTFTDVIGHTFTPTGSVAMETDTFLFGTSSGKFSGGYISAGSSTDFSPGSGDFTAEGIIKPLSGNASQCLMEIRAASGVGFAIYMNSSNQLMYIDDTASIVLQGGAIVVGAQTPWRVTKSGTTVKGFLWGVQVFTGTDTRTMSSSRALTIGANYIGTQTFNGYMQNFRYTIGVARDSGAAYTPQKVPFATS